MYFEMLFFLLFVYVMMNVVLSLGLDFNAGVTAFRTHWRIFFGQDDSYFPDLLKLLVDALQDSACHML